MGEYWPGGPLKVDHLAMAAVTIGELLTGILLLAGGRRCRLLLATQNTEHFEHVGVRLIDPWERSIDGPRIGSRQVPTTLRPMRRACSSWQKCMSDVLSPRRP